MTKQDRKLMLMFGAIIALLIVGVVLFTPVADEDPGFPSSYSAHSKGAKAAFLVLKESGHNVERWVQPPSDLPTVGKGNLLILTRPLVLATKEEREAIARFILGGGRVLAIGNAAAGLLPKQHVTWLTVPQTEWKEIQPSTPSALTRGGPITSSVSVKWKSEDAGDVVHYASDDGPVVVSYRYGTGEVIWWADDAPLTNAGISQKGNLDLLLNSVGNRDTHIYWDEYFHTQRHSAWSKIADTPLKWLLLQACLFLVAVLFTFSRRSGPIHPLVRESRLSPLEFVETLGALYKRAHASGFAVEVAYNRFRHLLTRRLGLQRDLRAEALAKAASQRMGTDGELLETLRACEQRMNDPELRDSDALALVQKLNDFARKMNLTKPEQSTGTQHTEASGWKH